MTRVVAPSRLHFGLLNIKNATAELRQFGGCGLMVQKPGLCVSVSRAEAWHAEGPSSERAVTAANKLLAACGVDLPLRLAVEQAPPEHVGLGVGTQLALATALAVQKELGLAAKTSAELAHILGRGARSAIGLHGFAQGGFLVDAGRGPHGEPAPLLGRYLFPENWPILLIRPRDEFGSWCGPREINAFHQHAQTDWTSVTDQMCRWLVLGLIPTLVQQDFAAFSEALYQFNRLAGEQFASDQGGVYASERLAELVEQLRQWGIRGVGQSSWGPTLFAVCANAEQANWLHSKLSEDANLELVLTHASNQPAKVLY